jgi:prophage antirepressor-like protein
MSDEQERLQRWGVWLPKGLLTRWRQVARQRGMTAPKLLMLVMTRVLDGAEAEVGLDEKSAKASKGRLFITLTRVEHLAVKATAKKEGHSLAGWVASVIRARLAKRGIYTAAELEALSQATLQMSAIGRTLNSAVYALHKQGLWQETAVQRQLQPLADQVREVTNRMGAIIEAAADRSQL